MYIDKLDYIINKYNNTYQRTIKRSLLILKIMQILTLTKKMNDKVPKFKFGDHSRISKYKNIFAKGYTPIWSEKVFVIKKIKNTVPWIYDINDINGE